MPDIFLSYSREDQATAKRFAEGFERAGFTVWWDGTLEAGEAYDQVTEKALKGAKAVVVLWSNKSVESRWVRAEATLADRLKTLVPVMIEPCERPIMFELTHTADLSHWTGDPNDKAWQSYLAGLRRFVDRGEAVRAAPLAAHGSDRGRRFSAMSLGVLAAVVIIAGATVWTVTRTSGQRGPAQPVTATQEAATHAPAAPVSAPAGVSLAVLPFVDMSPEHNQEYFSDGLAEELLNELAQIKELRVTGRTSSFSFKGKNEDLRVIGEQLGVSNLLEGSVRKDGNHLRITAQLINAKDGTHLWSQTFDRELSGVFAVQEEIAMAVSGALSITLDVGAMSREKGGTTNVEAYDKFLKARTLFLQGGKNEYVRSAQLYRDAVALDPAFARAWLGLYRVLWETQSWMPETEVAARKEQDEASAHIIALAPNAWWTQVLRADRFELQHKWSEEEAAASAALAAAPASEPDALAAYAGFLVDVGRVKEAVAYAERLREADPLSLHASSDLQQLLDMAGRPAEAQAEYERSKALAGDHGEVEHIALFRLMARKDADPATVKARFREFVSHETVPMTLNHVLLDKLENKEAARAAIRQAFDDPANQDGTRMLILLFYADSFGDRDLALAALRRVMFDFDNGSPWYPYVTNLRTDPRFKDLLRDLGLVDYWRTTGSWGDFCKPVGKDDFECH